MVMFVGLTTDARNSLCGDHSGGALSGITVRSKFVSSLAVLTVMVYVPVGVLELVEIVRVEVNVGDGIPLDGLKDEVDPDGRPFKLSETEEHDPPSRVDVMVMVLVSEFP